MPLFVCQNCKNIENTALSLFWSGSRLCSACDPEIKKWHNRFPQEKFNDKDWEKEEGTDFINEKNK